MIAINHFISPSTYLVGAYLYQNQGVSIVLNRKWLRGLMCEWDWMYGKRPQNSRAKKSVYQMQASVIPSSYY